MTTDAETIAQPDETRTMVTVRLPEGLYRRVKIEAATTGTTVQALVESAIKEYFGIAVQE